MLLFLCPCTLIASPSAYIRTSHCGFPSWLIDRSYGPDTVEPSINHLQIENWRRLDTNSNRQIPIGIKLYHERKREKMENFLNSYSLSKKSTDVSISFPKTLLDSFWYAELTNLGLWYRVTTQNVLIDTYAKLSVGEALILIANLRATHLKIRNQV